MVKATKKRPILERDLVSEKDTSLLRVATTGFILLFGIGLVFLVYASVTETLTNTLYFTFMGLGIFLCLAAIAAFVYYVLRKILHYFARELEAAFDTHDKHDARTSTRVTSGAQMKKSSRKK